MLMRVPGILIGIALGIGISALIALFFSQPKPETRQIEDANQPHVEHGAANPTVPAHGSENSQGWTENQKQPKIYGAAFAQFIETHEPLFNAISTAVIAVFTIVLAIATVWLWGVTAGLETWAQEQAGDMKQSIAATWDTAIAAQKSAEVSDTALRSTQRAFVYLDLIEGVVVSNNFVVRPKWGNSGTTPTKNTVNYVSWKYFPGSIPQGFAFPDLGKDGNPTDNPELTPMVIGPKATVFGQASEIPTSRLDDVIAARGRLLIWGWASYDDIFEGTSRHQTRFGVELEVKSISVDQGKIQAAVSFGNYGHRNCADQECERQGCGPPPPYPF
jgi:hypothetical protein